MTRANFIPAIAADATPAQLWQAARFWLAAMELVLDGPVALAAMCFVPLELRRELRIWLAPLEALARKLLLACAAALKLEPAIARPYRLPRKRPAKPAPDLARPETWVAPFALALKPPAPRSGPRIRDLGPHLLATEAWAWNALVTRNRQRSRRKLKPAAFRLARRWEALRRVLANPDRHALRLARRLARLSPRERLLRARRLAWRRWPPQLPPGFDPLKLAVEARGNDAAQSYCDSS